MQRLRRVLRRAALAKKRLTIIFNIMDITGNIIAILQAQSGISQRTGNTWLRQEYVVEVPGTYPKRMCFCIFGEDRIKQFNIQPGEQNITVQFDIDAHEHHGRWYNEIRAYNVFRGAAQQPYAGQPAYSASHAVQAGTPPQSQDDAPF